MNKVKLIPEELRKFEFPTARFLSEQEQKTYEEAIKKYSKKAKKSLNISQKGSNLFKVLLLNQIGIRTATLLELEQALENGMSLKGSYEDAPSVILRSNSDSYGPNDYLAKDLTKKLKIKSFKTPLVINGLKIKQDKNSYYGLSLEITDKTQIIKAPDFNHKNNQRKFSKINPDYTIEFGNKVNRTLYTRTNGFSRLGLGSGLGLGSYWIDLTYSGSYGRVVVVSGEATSQNFLDGYINNLQKQRDEQITNINKKYQKAVSVLEGKE